MNPSELTSCTATYPGTAAAVCCKSARARFTSASVGPYMEVHELLYE